MVSNRGVEEEGHRVEYSPNMNAQTLNSIWVMCNIVEQTNFGCDQQQPLLRMLPADTKIGHTTHNFSIEQFKKVNTNRIKEIKIWLAEDADGRPLDIYTSVYLRLEFKKHVG